MLRSGSRLKKFWNIVSICWVLNLYPDKIWFLRTKKMYCISLTKQTKKKKILTFPCWLLSNLKAWVAVPLFGFKLSEEASLTCFCIYSTKKESCYFYLSCRNFCPHPKKVKQTSVKTFDKWNNIMEFCFLSSFFCHLDLKNRLKQWSDKQNKNNEGYPRNSDLKFKISNRKRIWIFKQGIHYCNARIATT